MTKLFQHSLEDLQNKILFIGGLVEQTLGRAILALVERDRELAEKVVGADEEVDRLEVELEEDVLGMLALYQPVAADLRYVITVLKVNNDLERMGDLAEEIAEHAVHLAAKPEFRLPGEIPELGTKVQAMVKRSLDALVSRDAEAAREVCAADDEVDRLQEAIRDRLPGEIQKDPERVDEHLRVDGIARKLERLGDMATNVAEDVIFLVEAEIARHRKAREQGV